MKVTGVLFCVCVIFMGGSSCQKKVDIQKEKEAIMAVINAESETARIGDVEGLKACYVPDEYNTRFMISKEEYQIITGWDKLGPFFDQFQANAEVASTMSFVKENPVIKVMGSTAWVICENKWTVKQDTSEFKVESIQITFLEKADGAWKFSFAAWIPKPEPPEPDTSEQPQ
ncbi:MAG: nuclear transport factor 2 family protein [Bacteroidales bacterium]|jgi:hypothetical protein|nr:nuclear transport factor 2 family protein [Bacteroidales bacterium]